MPSVRRSKKTLPPERVKELKALARKIDREEGAAIRAKGRVVFARHAIRRAAIASLQKERERMGLTLDEVARRCRIDKANLSRLENSPEANPTIETLQRYAEALGKSIEVRLVDKAA